jgi:spectinomycin phosphotransferase
MLEKPDLGDEKIINCLRDNYGLNSARITFLPLGADVSSAVYKASTQDETPYFVKLRRGPFAEAAAAVPKFLSDQGLGAIITPITNKSGQLWTRLDDFRLVLYPFVEGRNGFEVPLSARQWIDFGRALRSIHTMSLPAALSNSLDREAYSPYWRDRVKRFQGHAEQGIFDEPVAAQLALFMKAKRAEISDLVAGAERLATVLQASTAPFVLCHSDIHIGNLLLGANEALYLVDWDNPILAPRERDLMFVGGGVGGRSDQEEALFYQGYGQVEINDVALVYYRFERIVQDMAAYCEQLFLTDEGGQDRAEGFRQFASQFLPNGVVDIAHQSAMHLPPELS